MVSVYFVILSACHFAPFLRTQLFSFSLIVYLCSIIISKQGIWCIGSIVVMICPYCTLKDKFYCQICCWVVACLQYTPFLTMIALTFYSRLQAGTVGSQELVCKFHILLPVDYSAFLEDYPMICIMVACHLIAGAKQLLFGFEFLSLRNNHVVPFLDDSFCSSTDCPIYENFLDNWYCSLYFLFLSVQFEIFIFCIPFLLEWFCFDDCGFDVFPLQIWYFIIMNWYCLNWKIYCHTWNIFSRPLK